MMMMTMMLGMLVLMLVLEIPLMRHRSIARNTIVTHTTLSHLNSHSHCPDRVNRHVPKQIAVIAMPAPKTKPEWVAFLKDQGENVPSNWTLTQIKAHWSAFKGMTKTTPLDDMNKKLSELNRAAVKKGTLMLFLQEMGLEVNANKTISQLLNMGTQQIIEQFEPMDLEMVGFGTHGNQTFLETYTNHPSYVSWVLKTYQEDGSAFWRLKRFARWIIQHQSLLKVTPSKKPSSSPGSHSSFSLVEKKSEELQESLAAVEVMKQELEHRLAEVNQAAQQLEMDKIEMQEEKTRKTRKEM